MNRRDFLKLMGAGSGAAMAGCTKRDPEKIVSYFVAPESWIPGQPLHFASTCTECPAQCGIQVKAYDKFDDKTKKTRFLPVKFEGHAGSPVNRGALCMRGQASVTRFYQPDRLKQPTLGGKPVTWNEAFQKISAELGVGKRGVWLSGRTTGTLSKLVENAASKLGLDRVSYEPASHPEIREANRMVFGVADLPHYDVAKAKFLLTIGADVVESFVNPVQFQQAIREAKGMDEDGAVDNVETKFQWWHIEPHMSLTGANADERLIVKAGSEPQLLAWLLRRLAPQHSAHVPEISDKDILAHMALPPGEAKSLAQGDREKRLAHKLEELVAHLKSHALVVTGGVSTQHAGGLAAATLTALLQESLGMHKSGVLDFDRSQLFAGLAGAAEMKKLADRLGSGDVGILFVSRANPVGTLPASVGFQAAMAKAKFRVAIAEFPDETTQACDLVLPLSSALESWGDAEPRRGTRSILQPVLFDSEYVKEGKFWKTAGVERRSPAPLHDTKSEGEIVLRLMGSSENWRDFLFKEWDQLGVRAPLISVGFVDAKPAAAAMSETDWAAVKEQLRPEVFKRDVAGITLIQTPTVRWEDGKTGRLPLLEEIPDPLTTITYGVSVDGAKSGWVSVSVEQAHKDGLETGDEVQIESTYWKGKLPVKVQQGLPDRVVTIPRGVLSGAPATLENVTIKKTGTKHEIPLTSGSETQEGRGIIPMHKPHPHMGHHAGRKEHEDNGLFPAHKHHPFRWAMAIDLEACTGCGACVAACYVENNVPIVGPADHLKGREMSWLRIEPFYDKEEPEFIPMLCQHCDNAPCEPVCPVFAAYHNVDGLNGQVYNRCVGTRYCSNNCPYKVRRFNWWEHKDHQPLVTYHNPEISVRPRGVMEKCTFCVQRIREAKDVAKDKGALTPTSVKDGSLMTACQQTCPSKAIWFGNILDEESMVYRLSKHERGYKVFEELNIRPAVTYLHPVEHKA